MGQFGLIGMLDSDLELRTAMEWHLQSNHYPPVPLDMVDACFEAIDWYNAEEYDAAVTLPEGVTFRGKKTVPAWHLVESMHLEPFLSEFHDSHVEA